MNNSITNAVSDVEITENLIAKEVGELSPSSNSSLQYQLNTHRLDGSVSGTPPLRFACHECGQKLSKEIKKKFTMLSESMRFQCDLCIYICDTSGDSKIRIKKKPLEQKLYICDTCPYKTPHRTNLVLHTRTHTGDKPYACSRCDYVSSHRTNLMRHKLTHLRKACSNGSFCQDDTSNLADSSMENDVQNRPSKNKYYCDNCNYRTTVRSELKKHVRTHTGERPYSCSSCPYKCSHPSQLTVHERKHSGEKPFVCDNCDYRSNHKTNLTRHMKTHTNEKPYACDKCDYRARVKCTLIGHMKIHKGDKEVSAVT